MSHSCNRFGNTEKDENIYLDLGSLDQFYLFPQRNMADMNWTIVNAGD